MDSVRMQLAEGRVVITDMCIRSCHWLRVCLVNKNTGSGCPGGLVIAFTDVQLCATASNPPKTIEIKNNSTLKAALLSYKN